MSTHTASMQAASGPQAHDDDAGMVSGEQAGNSKASEATRRASEEEVRYFAIAAMVQGFVDGG